LFLSKLRYFVNLFLDSYSLTDAGLEPTAFSSGVDAS